MRRGRGFTLIEMAVTVAVVAVLAAIAAPVVQLSAQRAREAELRTALRQIREAIDTYKRYSDEGRIARALDATGYPPTLEDLMKGVPDAKSPKGAKLYILRRIPRDPLNPALSVQGGNQHSQGLELSVALTPWKNWRCRMKTCPSTCWTAKANGPRPG